MDCDNINAACFLLAGLVQLSAFFRDPLGRHQASAIHLQAATVTGVQIATATATVSIGSMVFSSLNTPSPFLSENNSPK